MADVVTELRGQLEKRLRELQPLVKEHEQIQAALEKLADAVSPKRRGRPHKAGSSAKRKSSSGTRRGRPRGSGGRTQQALGLVQKQPGITIAEMAKQMKISPNYLYRVLPQLQADKKVKKQGKGYHPIDS
jgi:hypothetical protein